jgi:predicted nucleic acid-binding protein
MRFVDTNVLLYAVSTLPDEAAKSSKARAILADRNLVLSVQVLQEFYVQATRKSRPDPLTHEEAIGFIRSWRRFRTEDITMGIMDEALDIKARYLLSYWDSAVIAAAKAAGCTEVCSEDMNDGQDYGGVTVVNPFKT